MNAVMHAVILCLSVVLLVDLLQRHMYGKSYRELLNKPNKTELEKKYLQAYGHYFKLNLWHKIYLIIIGCYLTLMFAL